MSLASNVSTLATRVATECKSIRTLINGNSADLSSLTTTAKTSLVAALNELKSLVDAASAAAGATIDDGTTAAGTTWSSTKISAQITSAITALLNGAPSSYDTLKELADAVTALAQTDAGLLSFAAAQTLTAPQQLQGCNNLGVGDPTTNFVTTFNAGLV